MSEFQFQPHFYNDKADISMSIVSDASQKLNLIQKISLAAVGIGLLLLLMAHAITPRQLMTSLCSGKFILTQRLVC